MNTEHLTIYEAADKAKRSISTLRRAISAGDIGSHNKYGRTFVDPADLDAWIAARNAPAGVDLTHNLAHVTSIVTQITSVLSPKEAE